MHTGQHYDRELSQVFEELSLAELAHRASHVRPGRDEGADRPDRRGGTARLVLVYGDTNSTLAGAGAAAEAAVPLAHVEALARRPSMPEERNRIEVDRLAQLLLTPDERRAGSWPTRCLPDARWLATSWPTRTGSWRRSRATVRASSTTSASNGATSSPRCIARANVSPERLTRITDGLSRLPESVVFPAHPGRAPPSQVTLCRLLPIRVIDPLGYLDFAALASQRADPDRLGRAPEGGLLVRGAVRDDAAEHRVDRHGRARREHPRRRRPDRIVAAVADARMPDEQPPLYGDGRASQRIAELIVTLSP